MSDIEVSDADIDYFNSNCNDFEDLDALVSQLEFEEAQIHANFISFNSNHVTENQNLKSINDKLTELSEFSKNLVSEQTPFNFYLNIKHDQPELYEKYWQLQKGKEELQHFKDYQIQNIDDAVNFLEYILKQVNPFNNRKEIVGFTSEKFSQSLTIVQHYLNTLTESKNYNKNDIKINRIQKVFHDCEERIISCPFSKISPFFPFQSFYQYLLDPINNDLFIKYFNKFTDDEYIKHFLNCYMIARGFQPIDPSSPDFLEKIAPHLKHRHSKTITMLNSRINFDLQADGFQILDFQKDKIMSIIDEITIKVFVDKIEQISTIDYTNFRGKTLQDLKNYEDDAICSRYKNEIENLNDNDFNLYIRKHFRIFNVYFSRLSPTLQKKFEDLEEKIQSSNDPKKYSKLIELLKLIDDINDVNPMNYQHNLRDYLYEDAFKFGYKEMENIIYGNTFFKFSNETKFFIGIRNQSRETVIGKFKEKLNDFKTSFILKDGYTTLLDHQYVYLDKFRHGFLTCFKTKWTGEKNNSNLKNLKKEISKLRGENFSIQECCVKFLLDLYLGLEIDQNVDGQRELQIFSSNNELLINNLKHNADQNNHEISSSKRDCYADLLNIFNSVEELASK